MKKAKVFYSIGSLLLVLMGIGHFYGQFGPRGLDIQRSLIEQAMREYLIRGFGFQYSMMDVMQCWGIFFGVFTTLFGLMNVLILIESLPSISMIRFSIFNSACLAIFLLVGAMYVPFTAVGFSVILLCFVVSTLFFFKKKTDTF